MLGGIKNLILSILFVFSLTGCTAVTTTQIFSSIGWFAVDSAVEAETGKNVTDTVVSEVTGKDCELKNVFQEGEKICKEKEKK